MDYRFWIGLVSEEPGLFRTVIKMYKGTLTSFHNDWPVYMRAGGHDKVMVF